MNWLRKIPHSVRSASGLEWRLWKKLPWIALVGTLLPLAVWLALRLLQTDPASAEQQRWLQMAGYVTAAVVLFHWSLVVTVAIGCVIVMVMKGPGYQADSYPVTHSDQPRATLETEAEAQTRRHAPSSDA